MSLTEFLLARIAEDEGAFAHGLVHDRGVCPHCDRARGLASRSRVLVECEAKRRIVEDYMALSADYKVTRSAETEARRFQALVSVGQLAIVYADHPDYDESWRP